MKAKKQKKNYYSITGFVASRSFLHFIFVLNVSSFFWRRSVSSGYFTNAWRYGITNPNPDAGLVHQNGDLSPLGRVYVNLGTARRLQDVNASAGDPIFA